MKFEAAVSAMQSVRKNEAGATMAEAALIFPLVFLFFCGIIQWGLILTTYVSLYNAADVAGRFAVLQPSPTDGQIESAAVSALGPMLNSASLVSPITVSHNVTVGGTSGGTRVTLVYNMPLMFKAGVPGATGSTYTLTASVVYK